MDFGKMLMTLGSIVFALGLLLVLLPKGAHPLAWFGRLPGDISYSRNNTVLFIPLTSMIVVSALLSALLWISRRLFPPS